MRLLQLRSYAASQRVASPAESWQVTLQCLLATFLGIWGILGLKGTFLPIRTTAALAKQCAHQPSKRRRPWVDVAPALSRFTR